MTMTNNVSYIKKNSIETTIKIYCKNFPSMYIPAERQPKGLFGTWLPELQKLYVNLSIHCGNPFECLDLGLSYKCPGH